MREHSHLDKTKSTRQSEASPRSDGQTTLGQMQGLCFFNFVFCHVIVIVSLWTIFASDEVKEHTNSFWYVAFILYHALQTSYCAHFVRPQRKGSDRDTKRSISAVGRAKPRPSISVDCIIDLLVKHLCQVIKSKRSGTSTWPFHFLPSYDVHESVLAWTVIHWLHWLFESHRSRKIMFELSLFRGFQFLTFGNSQSSPWDFGPQRSERPFLPQLPGFALGGEGMIAAEKGSPLKLHLKQKLIMTLKRRMPLPGKHQVAGYERPKRMFSIVHTYIACNGFITLPLDLNPKA